MTTITLATLLVKIKSDTREYGKGIDGAKKKTDDFTGKLKSAIPAAAAGAFALASAAVVQFANDSVAEFQNFEKGMQEVFTLLPDLSGQAMSEMESDVLDFARESGRLSDEVIPALYQSISAGVPQDNVFEFLEVASDAARGGVTDLETAVDGITSVVNAYGSEVISAAQASDVMFTAVRLGKTNFEQLSNSLFNVIPTASSLGVTFEDVAANLAALTAQGTPTSVATTQLRQAFVEASKSGTKLDAALRDLHGRGFADLIADGMTSAEIFLTLRDSMPEQEFRDLFSSVEASNAVLGITSETAQSVIGDFGTLEDTLGATAAAADTMAQSIDVLQSKVDASTEAMKIQTGQALEPAKRGWLNFRLEVNENITAMAAVTSAMQDGNLSFAEGAAALAGLHSGGLDAAKVLEDLEEITADIADAHVENATSLEAQLAAQTAAVAAQEEAVRVTAEEAAAIQEAAALRAEAAGINEEFADKLQQTNNQLSEEEALVAAANAANAAYFDNLAAGQDAVVGFTDAQRAANAELGGYFDAALKAGEETVSLETQLYNAAAAAGAGAAEMAIIAAATGEFTDAEIEAAFQAALMRENIQQLAEAVANGTLTANDAVDALGRLQDGQADSAQAAIDLAQSASDANSELDTLSGRAIDAATALNNIPTKVGVHIAITADPIPAIPVGPGGFQPQHYETGGFTGGVEGQLAGLVHGEEFVFSAPAVRHIGLPALEELHNAGRSGRPLGGGQPMPKVEVFIDASGNPNPGRVRTESRDGIAAALRQLGLGG